jgi:hypothetical protein
MAWGEPWRQQCRHRVLQHSPAGGGRAFEIEEDWRRDRGGRMTEHYTDHEQVRAYAEESDAHPCGMVDAEGDVLGVHLCRGRAESEIYLGQGMRLRDVSWDVFFEVFDRHQLELRTESDGFQLRRRERHAA